MSRGKARLCVHTVVLIHFEGNRKSSLAAPGISAPRSCDSFRGAECGVRSQTSLLGDTLPYHWGWGERTRGSPAGRVGASPGPLSRFFSPYVEILSPLPSTLGCRCHFIMTHNISPSGKGVAQEGLYFEVPFPSGLERF